MYIHTFVSSDCMSDVPLYEGASITENTSYLLIRKFIFKHKLTGTALTDLLKFIEVHCLRSNHCCPSPYFLKKDIDMNHESSGSICYHEYCTQCFDEIQDDEATGCQNCQITFEEIPNSYFIQLNIKNQLQCLFQGRQFEFASNVTLICMYVIILSLKIDLHFYI